MLVLDGTFFFAVTDTTFTTLFFWLDMKIHFSEQIYRLEILLFLHCLHIGYIGILIYVSSYTCSQIELLSA